MSSSLIPHTPQNRNGNHGQGRVLTFDDILQSSGYVLLDTGVTRSKKGNWLTKNFSDLKQRTDISLSGVEEETRSVEYFIQLLGNSNVFVTPRVSQEIFGFVDILKNLIVVLSRFKKIRPKNWIKEADFDRLKEFYDLYETCYYKSRNSEFSPHQLQRHGFLERIVLSVSEETNAKIEYGEERRSKRREDLHTDEQLVASALYLSFVEGKSGAIITIDSDIKRILFNTLSYLTYPYISVYRDVVNSATTSGIRICYSTPDSEFQQRYNSSEFTSNSRLVIPREKLAAIRLKINSKLPEYPTDPIKPTHTQQPQQ